MREMITKNKKVFGVRFLDSGLQDRRSVFYLTAELSRAMTFTAGFLEALGRCREVLARCFGRSKSVWVNLTFFERSKVKREKPFGLKQLEECGLELPAEYHRYVEERGEEILISETGEKETYFEYVYSFPVSLKDENVTAILWGVLAAETGITPAAEAEAYFADYERAVICHPVDMHGVEIFGKNRRMMMGIFRDMEKWIAVGDRERLEGQFEFKKPKKMPEKSKNNPSQKKSRSSVSKSP